jgi:hypothetical protein
VFGEFAITLADGSVWLSIGQGLLFGGACLVFGVLVARWVGLLESDAPAGETLGVGLASGLLVLAAGWAAIASGGRSSFTPVAIGFAIALGLAGVRRWRSGADAEVAAEAADAIDVAAPRPPSGRRLDLIVAVAGGALFVVAVALLYGATMGPSPRNGVQPLEFMDEAYYSVLGADLATTGTESLYSPSGFTEIEGLPTQTWYHWGEAWLGAAAITVFGAAPLDARHLIVLPLLLLAAATLTGTLVRRMTGSSSRGVFLFGFLACLFLAPVPLAVGMVFEVRMYAVAAAAVLLVMYGLPVLGGRQATWALAAFVGSTAALILPAHIVIAVLALVGVGSVWAIRIGQSLLATRQLPVVRPVWRHVDIATGIALAATVGWGVLTGHGIGATGLSPSVVPFNAFWRETVAIVIVCSGAFLAIAVAWFLVRKDSAIEAGLYVGTMVLVVIGTLVWGARLGDFNTLHLFYGGLAVFAAPVAAVAVVSIWLRLRATGHVRLAIALLVLCGTQLEFGALFGIGRLGLFGAGDHVPVPVTILAAIEDLPSDAKLAYGCLPSEESSFWDAQLLGLDAHTGRDVVPMCFEAETFGDMTGTPMSADVPSPLFLAAPQRALYPTSSARPSPASVAAFLKANRIDYIYVDRVHPNTLVPTAIPVATSGETRVLRIP